MPGSSSNIADVLSSGARDDRLGFPSCERAMPGVSGLARRKMAHLSVTSAVNRDCSGGEPALNAAEPSAPWRIVYGRRGGKAEGSGILIWNVPQDLSAVSIAKYFSEVLPQEASFPLVTWAGRAKHRHVHLKSRRCFFGIFVSIVWMITRVLLGGAARPVGHTGKGHYIAHNDRPGPVSQLSYSANHLLNQRLSSPQGPRVQGGGWPRSHRQRRSPDMPSCGWAL